MTHKHMYSVWYPLTDLLLASALILSTDTSTLPRVIVKLEQSFPIVLLISEESRLFHSVHTYDAFPNNESRGLTSEGSIL